MYRFPLVWFMASACVESGSEGDDAFPPVGAHWTDRWQQTDAGEVVFDLTGCALELVVLIDDQVVPESRIDGFTYEAESAQVRFHGIYTPFERAVITASYVIVACPPE